MTKRLTAEHGVSWFGPGSEEYLVKGERE